ncbi:MAG: nucleoside-diphosphate kinase [Methanomicrobia archaeon]|nr:nucleoside-diphosphate kinase [Methanomicrobia archaeon]
MAKERTVVMIKPGGIERGLVGKILDRFEKRGLRIVALKLTQPTKELIEQHYAEHRDQQFFEGLVDYMASGEVILFVLEGEDAITIARKIIGVTDPKEAVPGTIRGDYGIDLRRNIIEASDSETAAEREIQLHFPSFYLSTKLQETTPRVDGEAK